MNYNYDPTMERPIWNFEQDYTGEPTDETGVNLRAYFDLIPDSRLSEYSRDWTDQQVMDWDGNFTEDGDLLLICSERDVDVQEYRCVLEECLVYRNRVRPTLAG